MLFDFGRRLELCEAVLEVEAQSIERNAFVLTERIVAGTEAKSITKHDSDFGIDVVSESFAAESRAAGANGIVDIRESSANCEVRSVIVSYIAKRLNEAKGVRAHEYFVAIAGLADDIPVGADAFSLHGALAHGGNTKRNPLLSESIFEDGTGW